MTRIWEDGSDGFRRAESSPYDDEHLPGDPLPEADPEPEPRGPEMSAPGAASGDGSTDDAEAPEEETPQESTPAARPLLSTPAMIIIGALVLALVITGGLYLRQQRINAQHTEEVPAPGQGESNLTPREGDPPQVQVAQPGQRIHVQGLYGTGWITVVTGDWGDEGTIPPARGTYLNIDLLVEVESGTLVVDSLQYAAYDLQGNQYVPTIGAGKDPFLQNQQLTGDQAEARGWVSFDVPKDATRVEITDEGFNPLLTVDFLPPS